MGNLAILRKHTITFFAVLLVLCFAALASPVSAQYPAGAPAMPAQFTGKYSNSDYGVQMTFPDGWNGMEVKSDKGYSVMAQPANSAGSSSITMIGLNMAPIPATTTTPPVNPNIPTDPQVKCNTISSDSTTVNGMSAHVTVMQCSGPNVDMKMKGYSFQTDKNYITVSLIANPSSSYDSNVATFDSAVNTLAIANTVAAPSAPPATAQNTTSSATTPEFPAMSVLILSISLFAIIGFGVIARKTNLSFLRG